MILKKQLSLRGIMVRGMIFVQALALVAFTILATVPLINYITAEQGLDDSVVKLIVDNLERGEDGELALTVDDDLSAIAADYPRFWFMAVDDRGGQVQMGTVPPAALQNTRGLVHVTSANISDLGDPAAFKALVRRQSLNGQPVWVMTGGGPPIDIKLLAFALSNPVFLGLLFLLTGTTLLVIPRLVERSLKGLETVAAEAEMIDVNQRGVRLSFDRVPTELHPMVRAFNAALERIDQGIERQHRFMADAAHELRTPIAILQTRIELLPETAARTQLLLDTARLSGMANQLLDLHRMKLGGDSFQPLDLVDLAAQVTADLAPLAIAAGDEIAFSADTDRLMIVGDAGALSRAVTNLVQNAMTHGGPNVSIQVDVSRLGTVTVSDTGPGIDPEHREEIFWPFHRIAPLEQGAGLGLSLVHDIVSRHGGRINVSNGPQGGAVFEIRLPLPSSPGAATLPLSP